MDVKTGKQHLWLIWNSLFLFLLTFYMQDQTSPRFDEETLEYGSIKSEADQTSCLEDKLGDASYVERSDPTWDPGAAVTLTPAHNKMQRGRCSPRKKYNYKSKPRPQHSCPSCLKKFVHYSSMTLHRKTHTGGIDLATAKLFHRDFQSKLRRQGRELCEFFCEVCSITFLLYTTWWKHRLKCHMVGHKCSHCREKFPYRKLLLLHGFERHRLKQPVKTRDALLHRCPWCSRTFLHGVNCTKHIETAHARKGQGSKVREYKCPHCKATYKYQRRFQKHLEQHKMRKKEQGTYEDAREAKKKGSVCVCVFVHVHVCMCVCMCVCVCCWYVWT